MAADRRENKVVNVEEKGKGEVVAWLLMGKRRTRFVEIKWKGMKDR